jgi:hypothetical protein
MKAGEVYENPVTGERVVIRVGAEECGGQLLVADLYVKPDGASIGEHVHPRIEEGLTVVRGRLGYRGSYPEYLRRPPREVVEVEPWRDFSAWPLSTDRRKKVDEKAKKRA